jgi:hypothetical protein
MTNASAEVPEGFNRDEVISYKGYISKFMCQIERDSFHEMEVNLLNVT